MPEKKKKNALWFFLALFGGGFCVWLAKSAFTNAWFAAGVAAGVVVLLMLYYMRNDQDAPEEEGDNVYYLGLLFTLFSLALSLVQLFGVGSEAAAEPKIRVLLENFGIALTSTIVGIAGRIAVQNWQRSRPAEGPEFHEDAPSPPQKGASALDLERFDRYRLERIARELTQGANALARFHHIVRSHASGTKDYLHNHSEALKQESVAFKDTLQRNAETFAEELRSKADHTLDTVGDSLGAVAKQAEGLLDQIRSAHEGYLAEVRDTTRSFHEGVRSASSESLDTVRRNLGAVTEQSLSLVRDVSAVQERMSEAFDRFGTGLGHASGASAAFENSVRHAAAEIDELCTALASVQAGAEATSGRLDKMRIVELTPDAMADEGEARHVTEAFRELADAAEALIETLRQLEHSGPEGSTDYEALKRWWSR